MPTVGQVVAVVDAQLGSGLLRCLGPGCGGRLARWGFGVERDLVGLGGVTGRVRPRRALCAACGVSRVLLPDSMLRRRQYGVEVIWAGLNRPGFCGGSQSTGEWEDGSSTEVSGRAA